MFPFRALATSRSDWRRTEKAAEVTLDGLI
jgi:hypothetical protein